MNEWIDGGLVLFVVVVSLSFFFLSFHCTLQLLVQLSLLFVL
jgi:hypothetical protein